MSLPLPPVEAQRLAELRTYAVLDGPPEKAFENITELAARIFRAPISSVTLIDEDRQWFKSCIGLETREVGHNLDFCSHAILQSDVMVVPDAREDARFAENPLVTGAPYIRFYAGAPLRTGSGLNLGALCIIDTKPRRFTKANRATLASLAALVLDEIQLRYEIGERRRAAESLRLLQAAVQQSSESVMITTAEIDLPGPEIIFVNPAFTQVTGYSAEEVIGKTPRILQGPKTERAVLDGVRAQLANGEEVHGEAVNYRKDGSEFILGWDISPICDETGKVTHFIGCQRDTTERHQVAAALQQAKEEAEQANRAKSEFISRMSHELRTPLHAILGFAQLLELDGQSSEDAESVVQITRAGKHLLGLINDVLDISRMDSGKLALVLDPAPVRQTVEETLSLIQPLAAQRSVRLNPPTGTLDCEVLSSVQHLKQVLLNLLSNAVKFNREGGAITVSCEQADDCLRISIADTGCGISAANIAKLFVPFERLDASAATEGAGLGLSLSKHLVEAMGGRIGVESTPGESATFWIELPLVHRASGGAAETPEAAVRSIGEPPPCTAPRTILYIEDNLSNFRLVERILARRPTVKLIPAMQGRLGIELARQHLPDLLLLDLRLPDMEGEDILRQLRADPRTGSIPIVMISADATVPQIARLLAAGADGYLTKPIDVRKFLAFVDAADPRSAAPAAASIAL